MQVCLGSAASLVSTVASTPCEAGVDDNGCIFDIAKSLLVKSHELVIAT